MKRAEMRIVGLSETHALIWVQRKVKGEWEQETMNYEAFDKMMRTEFPEYWNEYKKADTDKTASEWFYNFGESEQMKHKGESYIYR